MDPGTAYERFSPDRASRSATRPPRRPGPGRGVAGRAPGTNALYLHAAGAAARPGRHCRELGTGVRRRAARARGRNQCSASLGARPPSARAQPGTRGRGSVARPPGASREGFARVRQGSWLRARGACPIEIVRKRGLATIRLSVLPDNDQAGTLNLPPRRTKVKAGPTPRARFRRRARVRLRPAPAAASAVPRAARHLRGATARPARGSRRARACPS